VQQRLARPGRLKHGRPSAALRPFVPGPHLADGARWPRV